MLDLTKILEVGDKVQTTNDGIGEVTATLDGVSYPIYVVFEGGERYCFTPEGFFLGAKEDPGDTLRPVGFNTWEEFAESKKPKS